jgi:hypothetical protein
MPYPRPLTLTLAFFGALLAGLAGIAGSALLIANAHDLAQQTTNDLLGAGTADALGAGLTAGVVDEAAHTLTLRGVTGIVSAVLILAVALAIRGGATWARVVLTVLLLGALCANGVILTDVAPGATKALGVLAMVVAVTVVVLMFLPPSNRYTAAQKAVVV